jgi:hypothetical protein
VALCPAKLVVLIPQFALLGIAVSPDPLVFHAGAFVWWQAARLSAGKGTVLPIVLIVVATLVAILAKQSAAPLLAQTGLVLFCAGLSIVIRGGFRSVIVVSAIAIVLAAALAAVTVAGRPGELTAITAFWERTLAGRHALPPDLDYFLAFTWIMFESAYLAGGWMRAFAPAPIVMLALVVSGFGLVRCAAVVIPERKRLGRGVFFTALFVVVQLGAIYGTSYYLPGSGAQGRFLFGAIGPFAALCAVGLTEWSSPWVRALVCTAAVSLMVILDALSWATVIIPMYARWP